MRTLEHPLPSGMRDLLPPETIARRAIARAFLGRAELFGYEPIIPPAFEYAETIERGLGTLDPREIVRFVEPETGEVVALRPDVTPQIARLVATRLSSRPGPYRLAYDASVLRRRAGSRARTHRQIPQIGVELIGVDGPDGDLELLVLAATSLQSMGLGAFAIDLGHAEIVRSLLVRASPNEAAAIADALATKDGARLAAAASSLDAPLRDAILALPEAHGPVSMLDALPRALSKSPAAPSIAALRDLVDRLARALSDGGVASAALAVDLGEVRGHAYYTGPFFQILAEGPGTAVGGGGRYDGLLSRFGRTLPATGLALDVDALTWALRVVGSPLLRTSRRCVVIDRESAAAFAERLRARGVPAVIVREVDADAFARAWAYDVIVSLRADRVELRAPGEVVGRHFVADEALDELTRPTGSP
jgi:ATP phosphoribosyltransferase regulatory subunit